MDGQSGMGGFSVLIINASTGNCMLIKDVPTIAVVKQLIEASDPVDMFVHGMTPDEQAEVWSDYHFEAKIVCGCPFHRRGGIGERLFGLRSEARDVPVETYYTR